MKVSIFLLALFLNCVNLDELNKVQPINYLYSVVIANIRSSQAGSSNQATFQIQGTLKDSSGNPIANATLTLGVSQNLVSREAVTTSTTTDSNGNYTLNLRVGNFSVKVTDSSGVEIGAFRLNATSTTEKPSIAVTSGNMSLVVSAVTSPAPISPIVAPSNLSYSSSILNLNVGTAMTALTPSVSGTVSSYTVSPSLPTGLVLNPSSGMISGTPLNTQAGSNYTITARNSLGSSSYTITISVITIQNPVSPPGGLSYATPFLNANVGTFVTLTPSVSGVVSSYSIFPTELPSGLNFNTSSGILSGTPSAVTSTVTFEISANNSGGSSSFTLQIIVNPKAPSNLSYSPNPQILSVGTAMSEWKPSIDGTVESYYMSASQSLPNGLSLDSQTGIISGKPLVEQSLTSYTIFAKNDGGENSFVLQIKVNPLPPDSFSYSKNSLTLTANSAMEPLSPVISGKVDSFSLLSPQALPNGIFLDTKTGVISGTPTSSQELTTYTVSAKNEGGSKTFTLQIKINPPPPSSFSYQSSSLTLTVNSPMTEIIPSTGGMIDFYKLESSLLLPDGLSLDPVSGRIRGTPTTPQSLTSYTISANNISGSKNFTLQIRVNPLAPNSFSYETGNLTLMVNTPMTEINPIIDGIVESYTLVSPSSMPGGLNLDSKTGKISGTPSGFQPLTTYTISANNVSGSKEFKIQILITPSQIIRNWATFTDQVDGTIRVDVNEGWYGGQYYSKQKLFFSKCSHGQTYNPTFNFCTGSALKVQFCITNDPSCNNGNVNYPVSIGSLYDSCSGSTTGGKVGWRVPTKNELKLLINCNNTNEMPDDNQLCRSSNSPTINSMFPNTIQSEYWTSSSFSLGLGHYILFTEGGVYGGSKTNQFYVRCVNSSISNLAYPLNNVTLSEGATMSPLSPTIVGSVLNYTISPSLPTGLNFDPKSGVISGTPATSLTATNYVITANSSSDDSTSFIIRIAINSRTVVRNWATFTDMYDGTIKVDINSGIFGGQTYIAQTLYFAKCSHGQIYNSITRDCDNEAISVLYCNINGNTCNGGSDYSVVSSGPLFNVCKGLNLGSKSNWRVPTINELKLLINCGSISDLPDNSFSCKTYSPPEASINYLFPKTKNSWYWSSNTHPIDRYSFAWGIYFLSGSVNYNNKTNGGAVRCVSE